MGATSLYRLLREKGEYPVKPGIHLLLLLTGAYSSPLANKLTLALAQVFLSISCCPVIFHLPRILLFPLINRIASKGSRGPQVSVLVCCTVNIMMHLVFVVTCE